MRDILRLLEKKETLTSGVNGPDSSPHPVRSGISDQELEYLNKLYSRTVPTKPGGAVEGYCFVWTGAKSEDGYAAHRVPKGLSGSGLVHRFIWQIAVGPPPDDPVWQWKNRATDLTLHHKCGVRSCVNLWHLCLLPLGINREIGNPEDIYRR